MEDESVDTVVSMNGFHTFLDKQKAFHEIWRVLKPGGDFIACFYPMRRKTLASVMGYKTRPSNLCK